MIVHNFPLYMGFIWVFVSSYYEYVCAHTYIGTCLHIYTYIHTHIHIYMCSQLQEVWQTPIYHSLWLCCLNLHHRYHQLYFPASNAVKIIFYLIRMQN